MIRQDVMHGPDAIMLTESFFAATQDPEKATNHTAVGIHFHELQPLPALKSTFKKSSISPNCLATGPTHVFAAQADKAVVHVYSRERNNQEAVVPFPEKIRSVALAAGDTGAGSLVLGTEDGRLIVWELASGRQVITPQHHLQAVTCLAVDNHTVVSGSADANIHVWSLPSLLAFDTYLSSRFRKGEDQPLSPECSLSNHRGAITGIVLGHNPSRWNIAASVSRDNSCIIWDYFQGTALATYLLPSTPLCVTLDPVDRAAYVGYDDGTIQLIDFFKQAFVTHPLSRSDNQKTPMQVSESDHWQISKTLSSMALCVQVSYDGCVLLSGHQDGKVHTWNVGGGKYRQQVVDFAAPVTNLLILAPIGFPNAKTPLLKMHQVTKPRYDSFTNSGNSRMLSANYSITAQFNAIPENAFAGCTEEFQEALTSPTFTQKMLDQAFAEMAAAQRDEANGSGQDTPDINATTVADVHTLDALTQKLQEATEKLREREMEAKQRQQDDRVKAEKKRKRRLSQARVEEVRRRKEMKEPIADDQIVKSGEEEGVLSSDTNELTDSD